MKVPKFDPTNPKVSAGAAAAALVFIIMQFVGDHLDPEMQVAIGTVVTYAVTFATGWVKRDTLKDSRV